MPPPSWTQAPLFASLTEAQRTRLATLAHTRRLEADRVLFHEGDPCSGFFIVTEGAIQLTRASDHPGAHPTLATILPINAFAEAALFGGEAFPATATALRPTTVTHFHKGAFLGALRDEPDLALALVHAQAVWLRLLTQRIQQLSGSDSQERLAQWLQEHLPPSGVLRLPFTKKALAAQLGMTPETLSRGLGFLQKHGAIRVQGNQVSRCIPDLRRVLS
jgi:CRP/FNR family transcriptional regulator, dissimilatory nitrate respiration regulator